MTYKYWSDVGSYIGTDEYERLLFDRPMVTYLSIYRDYLIGDSFDEIAERRDVGTDAIKDMFNSLPFNEVIERFTEENDGKTIQQLLTEAGSERALRRLLEVLDKPDAEDKDVISASKSIASDFAGLTVGKKQTDTGEVSGGAGHVTFNLLGALPPGIDTEWSEVLATKRKGTRDIIDV
jgi:hypothetical protein